MEDSIKKESGHDFMIDKKYGYIRACPSNLGTGMRASVHIDLPGWTKLGFKLLATRCEELNLKIARKSRKTYNITVKDRIGMTEVEIVQKMIDGVNALHGENN